MGQLAQYFDTGNMKQDQKLTEKGKRSPIQDKGKSPTESSKTPCNNTSCNPADRHSQNRYFTGTVRANRRTRSDCRNDLSPCLRASLKKYSPEKGLISKTRRKLRFLTRRECPRKRLSPGRSKRPVKFVTGVGIVSEEDLPHLS